MKNYPHKADAYDSLADGFEVSGYLKKAKWHKNWTAQFPQDKAIVTTKSGHYIALTEPELVIDALKIIINRSKMSSKLVH